ncbi:hypothetical protein BUE80_DR000850 [Diplocarpon rosae]|nr:hypothetical protein BUE80_DR000850 [Diplocarpon rosae]
MAPKVKSIPWTDTQIAFIMEGNAAGASHLELETEVKNKWPDRELAKGAVANLIYRQKKKSKRQDTSQDSREPSLAASSRSENTGASKPKVGAPSIPGTPVVKNFIFAETFVTPDTSPAIPPATFCSPAIWDVPSPAVDDERHETEDSERYSQSLPLLPSTISTSFLQPTAVEVIEEVKTKDEGEFEGEEDEEIDEEEESVIEITETPQLSFEFPYKGQVNVASSTIEKSDTVPNSPILGSEAHKEPISIAERLVTNIFEANSSNATLASFEAEPEIADLFNFSSDNIQPELQEPQLAINTRPAKRVKMSHQTEEIENEAEVEIGVEVERPIDHMEISHHVKQAPEASPPQISTPNFIPRNVSITQQSVLASLSKMSAPQADCTRPKASNLFESLGSEIVHFIVGPKRKDCAVHTNLLTQSSDFFKNITFDSTQPGRIEYSLPDADSNAIAYIFNWLYRQKPDLFLGVTIDGTVSERGSTNQIKFTTAVTHAIEIYLLAEKLDMLELEDIVMTALGAAYYQGKIYPSFNNIVLVYSRSDSKSPLRKYMARSYQMVASLESEGEEEGEGDNEIASTGWTARDVNDVVRDAPDLFKDYRRLSRKNMAVEPVEPALDPICAYHAHGPDAYCEYKNLSFAGMLTS